MRSEPRPRERVHSKVALEVKQRSTSNVTELLLLERAKGDASLPERSKVVGGGIKVNLRPEGPTSPVVGHAHAVVRAGHLHRVAAYATHRGRARVLEPLRDELRA